MWKSAVVATCLIAVTTVSAQPPIPTPPRFEAGALPELQALAVGPGQVFMELSISPAGEVTSVAALRTTGRQAESIGNVVRRWRFKPATVTERRTDGSTGPKPVASKALVAAFFRSPTVRGPSQGELPKDVGSPSVEVPLPVTVGEPTYPATSLEKGVVMIEALVNENGQVTEARVISSAPAFDSAALAAARQWRFRPARVAGRVVGRYAYLIFGFPQPITLAPKG